MKKGVYIMGERHGSLSINSENIFPIIKKWLYSDHDIFFRELISNGCDAITKLKKLEMMGEYSFEDGHKNKIQVIVNPDEKTLKFIDTGLGMDADEVEEYINQICEFNEFADHDDAPDSLASIIRKLYTRNDDARKIAKWD